MLGEQESQTTERMELSSGVSESVCWMVSNTTLSSTVHKVFSDTVPAGSFGIGCVFEG